MASHLFRIWFAAKQPVDAASVAVFRIALGALIAWDATRKGDWLFNSNDGKIFAFHYEGFEWIPSAGHWGDTIAAVWLISALCVMVGLLYRPAIILATSLTIFGFLQAEEYYLNHYYLLIINCFLMCFVPANRAFALDRVVFRARMGPPVITRLHLWLLKGQTEIVLLYAGIVKINSDWLQLEPLRSWLIERQDRLWFGAIFESDLVVAAAAYGVIILHVLGAPLLLWRRTRMAVFCLYALFHISNHFVFDIGIFPWMTIAMSTLFFASDWPRRLLKMTPPTLSVASGPWIGGRWLAGFACVWLLFQAVLPLRHFAIPGDVAWTYEGHRFSWRMKLVDRWSPGVVAVAYAPDRQVVLVPPLNRLLTERQHRKASTRSGMARRIAPQVAELVRRRSQISGVAVHLYMPVGYNNRKVELLVDPGVDLARADVRDPWIIKTNTQPLRRREDVVDRYEYPPLAAVLTAMGLPKVSSCKTARDSWLECKVDTGDSEREGGLVNLIDRPAPVPPRELH